MSKETAGEKKMLRDREKQGAMEIVILEQMIPEDHLLRRIDRAIDFSFIHKLCEPLYCPDNGRPATDPELLFRMIFIGYLYGVKSERRLEEEVNYNLAYKWFCGLGIMEKAPDATTLSANRRRRFRDNNIAEQIFDEILRQAIKKGLVSGKILYTDSTHIKAKANKHRKQTVTVEVTPKEYLKELDEAVDADRQAIGKKPFERDDDPPSPPTREIQQSLTDPDSGQLHKEGKPDGFHYSEHRTVDSRHNVIVNVRVTPATTHDVDPIPDILRDIQRRLGTLPDYMGLDAGYHCATVAHQLADRGIQAVIGYRRHSGKGERIWKYRFSYDPARNAYICPQKQLLNHRTTNREGRRVYYSDPEMCANCPQRVECLGEGSKRRQVQRHLWQDKLDQIDAFTKSAKGRRLYQLRKETVERSFAEAKENHGLRTARMLGRANMREQSFLTAAVQNMKRILSSFSRFLRLFVPFPCITPCHTLPDRGFVVGLNPAGLMLCQSGSPRKGFPIALVFTSRLG
jgi:transposase